jgi:hypothetical protein
MIFIGIALIAIFLYIRNYKISALLLFFFFITSGFNLLPEEATKFAFISKGTDYAFLILVGIILIDGIFNQGYFNRDHFTKYLIFLGVFLLICIFYNKLVLKLGWGEILRTCRYQFFWIAYFLFRHTPKNLLENLLKVLFFIALFTSSLFLLQIITGKTILLEGATGYIRWFGIKIPRFYNQPDLLFFFTFMAIYHNPLKGIPKHLSTLLLTAALLGAFHRSAFGCFFIAVLVGYVIRLPHLKKIRIIAIASILLLLITVFWSYKFVHSRTYTDVKAVISGNFMDTEFDMDNLGNATFTFRILHLLERNQYLLEHPQAMALGAGLMPEDSKQTEKIFDFKIGLVSELTDIPVQLDSGDISYSVLFLRLGYVGTALYLSLIIYLMVFFYKNRNNRYALFSLLYLVFALGVSFFSANLLNPVTFLMPLISYLIVKKTDSEVTINEN